MTTSYYRAGGAIDLNGVSTTSVLIGTGSKTFTTQANKQWKVGTTLTAASAAGPSNYMAGQVTSYSGTTLTLNVTSIGGSGTFADWNIVLSGPVGATGPTGATGDTGPQGPPGVISATGGAGTELQYRFDGTTLGGAAGTAWDNTNRSLAIVGATVTANAPILDLSQTWDNGAVTFTGIKFNVTNTASGANSGLLDLQIGGNSRFFVGTAGGPTKVTGASAGQPRIQVAIDGDSNARINFGLDASNNPHFAMGAGGGSARDTFIYRDAAQTLAQRNGANAQEYRIYNTFTDAANYERVTLAFNANVPELRSEKAGTGTARNIKLLSSQGPSLEVGLSAGSLPVVRANFSNGNTFNVQCEALSGTPGDDLVLSCFPGGGSTRAVKLEAWASTGLYLATGNANPIVFQINRVEQARLTSNVLSIAATTTAQTLRVYRTTDSNSSPTNYARLAINDNQIKTEILGTGTVTETTNRPVLDLAQTWNNVATTFTALKLNITDTTSAGNSKLVELQVGGSPKFSVSKAGNVEIPAGNQVIWSGGGYAYFNADAHFVLANSAFSNFVNLFIDANNTLAQRNSTNAQTFRIYNTESSSLTNYERIAIGPVTSGAFDIIAQTAGTGAANLGIRLTTVGTGQILLTNPGAVATVKMQCTSSSGYAAVDSYNSAGSQVGSFGYGNSGVGGSLASAMYIYSTNSTPIIFSYNGHSAKWDTAGSVAFFTDLATPAGGSTAARLVFGSTAGFGIYIGSGAPSVSAAQGSIYLRSDGSSTSTRLYVNTNGTTGWTNVTTAT
jgi:hypothetical protein